ncbi:Methionine gamma-lyase [compost metagenome]
MEERLALGISEGLVRISVGIEETDDLLADLAQACASVREELAVAKEVHADADACQSPVQA